MNMRARVIAVGTAFVVLTGTGCATTSGPETVSAEFEDKAITSAIKARHAASADADITDVSVETLYGVVLLSGFAKNAQVSLAAQNLAGQVDGVKAVHNDILIRP